MPDDLHARLGAFLARHTTLSLATAGPEGRPHAASLFYAETADLRLIFVSEASVRHSLNLAARPEVAAAIAADRQDWEGIQGVQLEGTCRPLHQEAEARAAWGVYAAKFPFAGENEALARRLRESGFYQIRPTWIRLIDNTRGFGFKEELRLAPEEP